MKELSGRTLAAAISGVVVVGGLLTLLWLTIGSGNTAPERAQARLELVRIGLTIALGGGGLFGLYLAWRRQRSIEIGLAQKQRDQADVTRAYELQREAFETTRLHQERVAAATERDAEARRITELYTKAVEQLGSEKAPVRLGGLYALERRIGGSGRAEHGAGAVKSRPMRSSQTVGPVLRWRPCLREYAEKDPL